MCSRLHGLGDGTSDQRISLHGRLRQRRSHRRGREQKLLERADRHHGSGSKLGGQRRHRGATPSHPDCGSHAGRQKRDLGACLAAGTAATQSVAKYKSMQSNNDVVQSNLSSIHSITSPTQEGATADGFVPQHGGDLNSAAATGGDTGGSGLAGGGGATGSNPCGSPSSANAVMQCAIASSRNLPGFVGNANFPSEFQKDAGIPLSDFLSHNAAAAPMMAAGMSRGLPPDQGAKVDAALNDLAQNTEAAPSDYVASTYVGGGGGGGSDTGDDSAAQMGAMMQGLMDKLNPGNKKDDTGTGVSAVIFANQNRSPAAVAEDRKLSIFDRVTYRYYFVGRRIVLGEGEK